jgi:hypothetical protein
VRSHPFSSPMQHCKTQTYHTYSLRSSGEGGAGTWSDGKLTTRIGRNSDPVRKVLTTLYALGAPEVRGGGESCGCISFVC